MHAKLVEGFTYMKPKSSEEIKKNIDNMPLEELQQLLYDKGMDLFDSNEAEFLDYIYKTIGREKILSLFLGEIVRKEYSGVGGVYKLNTIDCAEDFLNSSSYPYELEYVIQKLPRKEVNIMLDYTWSWYKQMNEDFTYLKPKDKEEIDANIEKLIKFQEVAKIMDRQQKGFYCLYVWESDSTTSWYHTNPQMLLKSYHEAASETANEWIKYNSGAWRKIIGIYKIDIDKIGTFSHEREMYGYGGVDVLFEIDIDPDKWDAI